MSEKWFIFDMVHFTWNLNYKLDRIKRIWYLSPMRAAKVQASLRIRAVTPEPSLLAHTSSESRGTFRQKVRSPAPLNGWACAVKICHDGMLEDTNSLDGAQFKLFKNVTTFESLFCSDWLQDRTGARSLLANVIQKSPKGLHCQCYQNIRDTT